MGRFTKKWQKRVYRKYYEEHESILSAAQSGSVSRQTASKFLKAQPEWDNEQRYRRELAKQREKASKRRWDFFNRLGLNLKREHEQAVRELSAEKYH